MGKDTVTTETTTLPKLKPAEILFVKAYTDPTSDTYNNATRSSMKAYPSRTTFMSNADNGHTLLKRPEIRTYMMRELERIGLGDKVLAETMSDILHNRHVTVVETTDKEGNITTQRISPSPKDRMAVVKEVNKLTGKYEEVRTKGELERKAYNELMNSMRQQFRREGEGG